jgi:hypothetical protein
MMRATPLLVVEYEITNETTESVNPTFFDRVWRAMRANGML